MAKKRSEAISASELRIVDDHGNTRAWIGMMSHTGKSFPTIRLYDDKGRERLVMELRPDGSPLGSLLDSSGAAAIGFGADDGRAGIQLWDNAGQIAFLAEIHPDGSRQITAFDKSGTPFWDQQKA